MRGHIKSAEACQPIDKAKITHVGSDQRLIETVFSGSNGEFQISHFNKGDTLVFEKKGFVQKKYIGSIPELVRLLDDKLIGYHDKLFYYPGDIVTAYVNSRSEYSMKLFRHGIKKEKLLEAGHQKPIFQQVPDELFVDKGLSWKPSIKYKIPEIAKPGLYSVLLEAGEERFAMPLVVSTKQKKSKVLVLASTNTWVAYNQWGGRNRFRNLEEKFVQGIISSKKLYPAQQFVSKYMPVIVKDVISKGLGDYPSWYFKLLSVKRPLTNCCLEDDDVMKPFCNHLAAAEWRVLAWLEKAGISYDIITGYELHTKPDTLKNYKALILNTHSEYWTREMYEQLKKAHENGLWIVNIGASAIYSQMEFAKDSSVRCTSLLFHESCEDESRLLAARFSEDGYGTCAPYDIVKKGHWALEGILTKDFGEITLNQKLDDKYDQGKPGLERGLIGTGASGWEMDQVTRHAPPEITVIAKGRNRKGGSEMVVREPGRKRGGMFNAASLTFGGSLLVDEVSARIVKNVLTRSIK